MSNDEITPEIESDELTFQYDTKISNEDIVAIRVATEENNLNTAIEAAKETLKAAIKKSMDADNAVEKESQKVADRIITPVVKDLMAAVKPFGVDVRSDDGSGKPYKPEGSLSAVYAEGRKITGYKACCRPPFLNSQLIIDVPKKETAKLTTLKAAAQKAVETKKEIEDQIIDLKRQVANLPKLERQVRAAVAAQVMNQSAKGRALLARMDKVTVAGISHKP